MWAWLAAGIAAYLFFPWYALQDANGLLAVGRTWSAPGSANGLLQAASHGKPWLLCGLVGLLVCGIAAGMVPGRRQGAVLIAGGLGGALALLASGFAIGAKGWSIGFLAALFGELAQRQFGMGWGGALALAALTVLGAFGLARRGFFRGDLFVAAAVVACG